jgi:gluconolactonase
MSQRNQPSMLLLGALAAGLVGCGHPSRAAHVLLPTARAADRKAGRAMVQPPAPADGWLPMAPHEPPVAAPVAIVDLASPEAISLVRGEWRYSDVSLLRVAGKEVGADLKPSGNANHTYDFTPKAQPADFDDSKWPVIDPGSLEQRRGQGKLSFGWYRLRLTVPARLGDVDPTGMALAFEIVVDDYAEVWVNGALSAGLGTKHGPVVSGFNAPNRVLLTRDARPGQSFSIAVFAMNGPVSKVPDNFLWIRSATLEVSPNQTPALAGAGQVERLDAALDLALAPDSVIEKLASGFQFTEGPAWNAAESTLFFSDPNGNGIYRYDPVGALSLFRTKSGYKGLDVAEYHQPGSNGLAFDKAGRLTIDEHGNRRVTRLEPNGSLTVLADRFEGKRLNSPNDLVYKSDGSLYFTDPPFGLPRGFEDPKRELPFSGIFRVRDGELSLMSKELSGPNGLAFSPDEHFLYVDNWETARKVVLRYPVQADGTLGTPTTFFDMAGAPGDEALDGLKVDQLGNLYVSGPGGVWIISPEGKRLGMLHVAELPANFAWGDTDRRSLYMTARTGIYRVRLKVPGALAFAR